MTDAAGTDPLDGPWTHRKVAANGSRFHVAEAGEGPLVLLLHGFPTFWWTWRAQLPRLAAAGYRAAAMDLRGYGGSDKPPRGYDPLTLAADITGVVRSLGAADAVLVGQGWGGLLAWTAAVTEPTVVRGLVPVSAPHPRRLRASLAGDRHQLAASRYALEFQRPRSPEHRLTRDEGAEVGQVLRAWSGTPQWPDDATARTFGTAFAAQGVAHSALEYYRWAVRSVLRPDGRRYQQRMAEPVRSPVLHVVGVRDRTVLPSSNDGSEDLTAGGYRRESLDTGHFVHEEAPEEFGALLLDWLAEQG